MNIIGSSVRCPAGRRAALRVLALLLLAAVALVPTLARAHDRLDHQPTPAQRHSRFRWTNSCESVPQKTTRVVAVQPVDAPAQAMLQPPTAPRYSAPPDSTAPPSPPFAPTRPLRAPPVVG